MATPMEAEVDQRLSMSLDDLIKSKKKAAPKPAAKAAGSKAGGGAAAKGGAPDRKPPGRRQRGAKGKQPAVAKPAAGGAAKAAGRKRGGRAAGTGLNVKVAALKNAPKRIAKAAANAITAATAMVTGGGNKGRGRGSAKPKAGGRGSAKPKAGGRDRSRGRAGAPAAQAGAKPVADLRVTIDNKLHGSGQSGRGRGAGGHGGGRQNRDGVKIPNGW